MRSCDNHRGLKTNQWPGNHCSLSCVKLGFNTRKIIHVVLLSKRIINKNRHSAEHFTFFCSFWISFTRRLICVGFHHISISVSRHVQHWILFLCSLVLLEAATGQLGGPGEKRWTSTASSPDREAPLWAITLCLARLSLQGLRTHSL